MKNKLILILAVIFGLGAAFGTYQYTENLKRTYQTSGNYARVAVAKQKISVRTVISSEMLDFKEMPVEYISPGTIVDVKDVAGKIAAGDIYPGEVIISGKLLSKADPAAGLSAKIEADKRAISLPVNNITALHGLINIGDHVDVLVTFSSTDEEKLTLTSTIIQNVPVLAINKSLDTGSPSKEELQTVTLMVEPSEAQQIALAIQQGSIQLTLRFLEDDKVLPMTSSQVKHLIR